MRKVIDNIYWIEGLSMGRVYFIDNGDDSTLIDTATAGSLGKIEKDLATQGRKLSQIKRILITHAHPDHIGSVGALQAATEAAVYVHQGDAGVTAGTMAMVRPNPATLSGIARVMASVIPDAKMEAARVDRELQAGDVLEEVAPGCQVIATPGHSPGHVSYWLPTQRLLFTGDVVMRLPKLRLPFAAFTPDMAEEKRSLRKVAALDIDILCFGHGDPIIGNAATPLRQFANQII